MRPLSAPDNVDHAVSDRDVIRRFVMALVPALHATPTWARPLYAKYAVQTKCASLTNIDVQHVSGPARPSFMTQ